MINKTFMGTRYKRTYIGGSEQKELQIFLDVQANYNWSEYKKILSTYFDDILHVLVSWKTLMKNLSFISLLSTLLFFETSSVFFTVFISSIIFQIVYIVLKHQELIKLKQYNMCLTIVLNEMNKD